jgi:hypothetical protein
VICGGDPLRAKRGSPHVCRWIARIPKIDLARVPERKGSTRAPEDVTVCSDVDMMSTNADGRFVHRDGTLYRRRLLK